MAMGTAQADLRPVRLTIGGTLVAGADGTYPVCNPVRPEEVVVQAPSASLGQLDQAVAAARQAAPSWEGLGFEARASCLQAAREQSEERFDVESAATLLTREHGKVLVESIFDMATTAGMLGALAPLMAEALQPRPAGNAIIEQVPHGVVAAILPFNWPAAVMGNKIIPALLAGNTVVVKTPPTCSGAVLELAAAIAAGLPPGVLNTLNGPTPGFGAELVAHPGIDMVTFTGGSAAGRSVLAACAQHLRPAVLELGGNDPAIIAPDLDPTEALADRLLEAAFTTSGQVCMAIKRLYLPAERMAEWRDALAERLSLAVVGDGIEEGVTMGPVHTEAARDRVEALIDDAVGGGGVAVRPASVVGPGTGWTVSPALVVDPDPRAAIVREEQFAPALPLLPYERLDDAVEAANDTRFGLCASVWSQDLDLAGSVAQRLSAGTVWTNAHGIGAMDHLAPMGGWGESGLGLEMGVEGMAAFSRPRVLRRGSS
jgi:acyl-CoA reductase-like NAD-dependent aldehyde dehydrogenase